MKRLRTSETGQNLSACLGLSAPLTPAPPKPSGGTGEAGEILQSSPKPPAARHTPPALYYSSSSASDFIWLLENVDYVTAHFQAPALLKGLSDTRVLPQKTQQLSSWIRGCSAAQAPQGRHPGHEYIQDI